MSLARVNLFANSYIFLAAKARPGAWRTYEAIGIICFWLWFGTLVASVPGTFLKVGYVLAAFVTASPVHVQVTFS